MHRSASEAVFLKSLNPQLSVNAAPHFSRRHVRSRFKPVNHSMRDNILTATDPNAHNEVPHKKLSKVLQYFTKQPKPLPQETCDNDGTPDFSRREHDGTVLLHSNQEDNHTSVRDFWKTIEEDVLPIEARTGSRQTPSAASSIRLDIYDAFASMQIFEKQSPNLRYSPSFINRDKAEYSRAPSAQEETRSLSRRKLVHSNEEIQVSLDSNTEILCTQQHSRRGTISRFFRRGNLLRRTGTFGSRDSDNDAGPSHFGTDSFPTTEFVEVQERGSERPDLHSFWCRINEKTFEDDALNSDHKATGTRVTYKTLAKLNLFDSSAPVSHISHQRNSITTGQQLLARRTLHRVRNGTMFCKKDTIKICEAKASPVLQLALRVKVNPQLEAEHAKIERLRVARAQGLEENDYGEQRFGTRCDHSDWYRDSQVAYYYETNGI